MPLATMQSGTSMHKTRSTMAQVLSICCQPCKQLPGLNNGAFDSCRIVVQCCRPGTGLEQSMLEDSALEAVGDEEHGLTGLHLGLHVDWSVCRDMHWPCSGQPKPPQLTA